MSFMDHAITLRGLMIAAGILGIPLSIAGTLLVAFAYSMSDNPADNANATPLYVGGACLAGSIGLIVAGKWL
jgi:hypothetical protein